MSVNQLPVKNNLVEVINQTLYPEATYAEAEMIIVYCRARKIDPMLKPVHLVPMSVKTNKKNNEGKYIYEYRNVVMPGIALYRIDASRTGQYAGMSEPEFGEDVTETIGSKKITYPRWCKITVKKLINGNIYEFSAKEFWKENYSTKSRSDISPNDMWTKRAYGQLAKCTEAQVLRKAFPEAVSHEYTKEEMEGKTFDHNIVPSKVKQLEPANIKQINEPDDIELEFVDYIHDLMNAETLEQLKCFFDEIKKRDFKKHPDLLKKLVDAKDKRKLEILAKVESKIITELDSVDVEAVNETTGEVL